MSLEVVFPIDAPQSDVVSWLRRYGGIVDERLVISDGTLGRGLFAKAQRGSGGNPLNPLVLDVGLVAIRHTWTLWGFVDPSPSESR